MSECGTGRECYSFSTAVSVAECGERIARESDESQTKLKFGIETSPDRSVFTLRLRESEKVHIRKAECERERGRYHVASTFYPKSLF